MTRTEMDKMLAGEWYSPLGDDELSALNLRAQALLRRYHATAPDDDEERDSILSELFRHLGEDSVVKPPFSCDYGFNIRLGRGVFINYDCVILDCAPVDIGDQVLLGPSVQIYTARHPEEPEPRRAGLERAEPVAIGAGSWVGGGAIICPGVTIGENAVIGAGSVVLKDVPPGVLAAGNPARVIRKLAGR